MVKVIHLQEQEQQLLATVNGDLTTGIVTMSLTDQTSSFRRG